MIQVNNVVKSFDGFRALGRSDHVGGGRLHLRLVGPNGAGKSTLIKVLTGVHAPMAENISSTGRRFP